MTAQLAATIKSTIASFDMPCPALPDACRFRFTGSVKLDLEAGMSEEVLFGPNPQLAD